MTESQDETRIPVIIGVGQVNDRPVDDAEALDSRQLMEAAIRAADQDAGGGFIDRIDWMGITRQISFPSLDKTMVEGLCGALGIAPAHAEQSKGPNGDTPIKYLNDAANAIGEGRAQVAVIVGGEALRTAAKRPDGGGIGRNLRMPDAIPVHVKYGVRTPTEIYPFYENAGRKAWGQTLAQGQAETGVIWSRFAQVAAENQAAWLRKPMSADEIITPSASNRPIAFPYTKLTVANSSVNQGAGFIVTSLAEARRRGIAEDRLVHVGMGAAAKEAPSILQRDRYDRSVSMEMSICRTLELNSMSGTDFDFVELYSCFPCVPKMARRLLNWPLDKPVSVFGGLTFGGGPIGNYMSHAVVAMVRKLRAKEMSGGGTNGFLFANGGFATDNHCIVLSNRAIAAATFPQDFDYQAEADAARGTIPPLDEDYAGAARVESYTVFYNRDGGPRAGVVVARTPAGARTLAHVDVTDTALLAFLTEGKTEPVGTFGTIQPRGDLGRFWTRA